MCLFPVENSNFSGLAYKKGVREFDCGACPECLRKRSNVWALRSVYECKTRANNCMITLTYDTFKYNEKGDIVGENPVNPFLEVNKRHIQLFIKRLRKWYFTISNEKIKYICCAEYGSRTHRAHYHLLLFGVKFSDVHFYKKSKRGNVIYMSQRLNKLWKHGICTIDSVNVHSGIARYCTKYCAKSRSDNTFMLCSQGIGVDNLLKEFNGKSYIIDGREYPIPRVVWERYIVNKYQRKYSFLKNVPLLSPKYVNRRKDLSEFENDDFFDWNVKQRAFYRRVRDKDKVYINYLDYWKKRGEVYSRNLPKPLQRIYLLDERKFHNYKSRALECYNLRRRFVPAVAPNSNCVSSYLHWYYKCVPTPAPRFGHLPLPPRPIKASDTFSQSLYYCCPFNGEILFKNEFIPLTSTRVQLIM